MGIFEAHVSRQRQAHQGIQQVASELIDLGYVGQAMADHQLLAKVCPERTCSDVPNQTKLKNGFGVHTRPELCATRGLVRDRAARIGVENTTV